MATACPSIVNDSMAKWSYCFCQKSGQVLLILIVWNAFSIELRADYDVVVIRTVEWLVDSSDVIAIVLNNGANSERPPEIVRVFKGDSNSIQFPLTAVRWRDFSNSRWVPAKGGPAKLVFIRERSEVLQEIELSRGISQGGQARVSDVAYGVTQYGNVLLSEAALFRAIESRLKAAKNDELTINRRIGGVGKGRKKKSVAVTAPADFPMESTSETFMLVVPFDTNRRDHYIAVLQSGDASEKIIAIRQLAYFDDDLAKRAITEATNALNASPAFKVGEWKSSISSPILLTSEDVQTAAQMALDRIEDDAVSPETKSLD